MWPFSNLKGFAKSRPPLVVFMVCLCAFGIILMSLAYFIETHEVKDPDLSADWNIFLDSFSQLQFCLSESPFVDKGLMSKSFGTTTAKTAVAPGHNNNTANIGVAAHTQHKDSVQNYSVNLKMTIHPTPEFLNISLNHTHLFGTVMGHQLGLPGIAGKSPMNITFSLPNNWQHKQCVDKNNCEPFETFACVSFKAHPVMFPITRSPDSCHIPASNITDHYGFIRAYKSFGLVKLYWCREQTKLKIKYDANPTLTVMLSYHDRSIITLHLMHTSCFLFVMVATMIFYAMVRGRPNDIKYHPVTIVEHNN